MRKAARAAGAAVVVVLALTVAAAALLVWVLLRRAFLVRPSERTYDLEIVEVRDGELTLRPPGRSADAAIPQGVFGLEWDGGYARLEGPGTARDGALDVAFTPVIGEPRPGARARLDTFAFPADPRTAHGMHFHEVEVPGELSPLPAWHLPGDHDAWLIFVHGKGSWRGEALRLLPVARSLGLPALSISYRGDEGVLPDPSGRYTYGTEEWLDLEAAVRFAFEHGATRIVPVGYSMGGAIVLNFLLSSAHREAAAGAILDSPMLDLRATVEHQARASLPRPARALMVRAARLARVQWASFEYLQHAHELRTPILLVHGDADADVPVSTSDRLAELRPDIVEYVRVPGAGHVLSWNTDPERYEARVRDFLARVLELPGVSRTV